MARDNLTISEAQEIVRSLIGTQAEVSPSIVGKTNTIVTLPKNGLGSVVSYGNSVALPKGTNRPQKKAVSDKQSRKNESKTHRYIDSIAATIRGDIRGRNGTEENQALAGRCY
jgi:hypothetical protein